MRRRKASLSGYYDAAGLPLVEVVRRYAEDGDKAYSDSRAGDLTAATEELYAVREYDRDAARTRDGAVPVGVKANGCPAGYDHDVPTRERWARLKTWMQKHGWTCDPAYVEIDREGRVKLAEGNHRVQIARELGLARVPVRYLFLNGRVQTSEYGHLWQVRGGEIVNVQRARLWDFR